MIVITIITNQMKQCLQRIVHDLRVALALVISSFHQMANPLLQYRHTTIITFRLTITTICQSLHRTTLSQPS